MNVCKLLVNKEIPFLVRGVTMQCGKDFLYNHDNPPGQTPSSQDKVWFAGPKQDRPPFAGAGLLHSLFRCWCPFPQETEHRVQLLQLFHSPSTASKNKTLSTEILKAFVTSEETSSRITKVHLILQTALEEETLIIHFFKLSEF